MIALTTAASPAPNGFKRRLAIILDGEIHAAPMINESIGGRGQITGPFTEDELQQLSLVLSSGQLAAPVEFVESETVDRAGE